MRHAVIMEATGVLSGNPAVWATRHGCRAACDRTDVREPNHQNCWLVVGAPRPEKPGAAQTGSL